MPWLRRRVLSLGVSIEDRHLQSLSDAGDHETRAIINCSGPGARTLVPDETGLPVRGQVHFLEPTDEDTLTNFVGIGIGEYCLDLSGVNPSDLEFSGRTSAGLRPIREGGCRIEVLWLGDRFIVHNY
jgi:hypothetical protein